MVNDCFTLNAVASFFLDDRRAVGGVALLDHRSSVPVIISVTFPNGNTSTNWADANANFIRKSRCGDRVAITNAYFMSDLLFC